MKPRNHVVLALLKSKRKSGLHEKSAKAERRQSKVQLQKSINDWEGSLMKHTGKR